MNSVQLTKDLYWIGTLDPDLKVFDIVMETKFGTSYNSYLLRGSKQVSFQRQFFLRTQADSQVTPAGI